VVFGFGPVFQDRVQRSLLRDYRTEVDNASNGAGTGPLGTATVPRAPDLGSTVGILEVGDARIQQAVVEGVRSSDTRKGPGHVPGTAGLGQPGNSVVVGRRSGFGGPFADIGGLHKGNEIVVTTTQGQSVYAVVSVEHVSLHNPPAEGSAPAPTSVGSTPKDDRAGLIDNVYGPSAGDQLTLITSGSRVPWNGAKATVVVAKLEDKPFPPTVQGGRHQSDTGGKPDGDAKAAAMLVMLVYGLAMGGAVLLYRRLPHRVAYLLTVAPVVALTIVAGETFSRLFPAWM
jgi:sortase A